jgi:maleylpyruvate isomerase
VSIALRLKGLAFENVAYNLREKEHLAPAFLALNQQGLLPAVEIDQNYLLP